MSAGEKSKGANDVQPPRPVVSLRGVRRSFGSREVLKGIDLDIAPGEFVAILGHSGTGKSTLLRAIIGLDKEVEGSVEVPDRFSVGFQEPRLLPWKKVWVNVGLGLEGSKADVKRRAFAMLGEVGLGGHEDAWPLTLSGGEAQRASLARALARDPELMVLDEPFGALDALTKIRMHGLLLDLVREHNPAVLLVTHDVEEAIVLADRAIVIHDGAILSDVTIDLPHPRARTHEQFGILRTYLLEQLGVFENA